MKFDYHNIVLNEGDGYLATTIPGTPLHREIPRVDMVLRSISRMYPIISERRKVKILDLGSLEGGHAFELCKMGFDVHCIEARADNVGKLYWLREHLDFEHKLRFHVRMDDVKNITNYGKYDVVLCLGLLYHLDTPMEFLSNLYSHTKDVLFLDTHYSRYEDAMYETPQMISTIRKKICKRMPALFQKHHYGLSKRCYNEGYLGRWYPEYDEKKDDVDKLAASSFSNSRSFWVNKTSLMASLSAAHDVRIMDDNPRHDSMLLCCIRHIKQRDTGFVRTP